MAGFDLTEVLKSVSDPNTEQIAYIQLDLIDPDPFNFYSLDGIDQLAANIELIGLQQPLRVRPGENGRFTIVSGHRRRAACLLIRDGGSEQFKAGVPCIVEYGEASDAMRKLRLIYANSSTRDLTSAELSRQAEEVETLLYELKEQGVVFPGRMRDHVAAAVQKSKSKLARLHAIRANLIPELLAHWDANEVKEETAYQLSRYPAEIQLLIAERMADPKRKNWPYAGTLESYLKQLDKALTPGACPAKAGEACTNCQQRVLHDLFNYEWAWCNRIGCCLDCAKEGRSCGFMCKAGKDRIALDRAVEKEKEEEKKRTKAAREEAEQKRLRKEAKRLLDLAERAGLKDGSSVGYGDRANVARLRSIVEGKQSASKYDLEPYSVSEARDWARKLNCSVGELLGDKPPKAETPADLEPAWQTGRPKKAGRYFVRVKHKSMSVMEQRMYFDPALDDLNCWRLYGAPLNNAQVLGWWPLPEEVTE